MSEYLRFELDSRTKPDRKTQVWNVIAVRSGYILGTIRWFGRWRQYTFFPANDTVFNTDCLGEILSKTRQLNIEQRRRIRMAASR